MANEMDQEDVVQQLSDATDHTEEQIRDAIASLSANQYINLVAAVHDDNVDEAERILQSVAEDEPSDAPPANEVKQRMQEIVRDKNRSDADKMDLLRAQIALLSSEDWDLIWPTMDKNMLRQLYHAATDKQTSAVSGSQAGDIYSWANPNQHEHAIYEGQLVEVRWRHGPNNTVGILLNNRVRMVPSSALQSLQEGVLGFSGMDSLARMRTLAGIDLNKARAELEEATPSDLKVILQFDKENPMDDTTVAILGGAGSYSMRGLRMKIRRESRQLAADLSSDASNYRAAAYNIRQLNNSLATMVAALDDLEKIRKHGGPRAAHLPEVLENEDS